MGDRPLTRKQCLALEVYRRNGELNEGMIVDECWPLIINARLVANGLVNRGLVERDGYIDEEVGYELRLTAKGHAVLMALEADHA